MPQASDPSEPESEERSAPPVLARRAKRILAFGSGKGGVGKSLLAANVAIYLAQLGKHVVLLDADLGGANAHTFVGIARPPITLRAFFEHKVSSLEEVLIPTAVTHLGLISAEGDPIGAVNSRPIQRARLMAAAQNLDCDYLVMDLPPGSGFTALDLFLMADVGVLVVVPEPTSVENAFRFIKSAFLRRLRGLSGIDELISHISGFEGGIPAPSDLLAAARELASPLVPVLLEEMPLFRPRLVVNQIRTDTDLDLGPALRSTGRRRLDVAIEEWGAIEIDDAVRLSIRKGRPLVIEYPETKVSKNIERVIRKILASEAERPSDRSSLRLAAEWSEYEVLEAEPGSSDEELRRCYRRLREIYSPESLAICGLYSSERLAQALERITQAHDRLLDSDRRRQYDQLRSAEGAPPRRRSLTPVVGVPIVTEGKAANRVADAASSPAAPAFTPETIVSGSLLRKLREARGVSLEEISNRTKVHMGHLRSIEEDKFAALPARVYVRGFVIEYAKALRLDPVQVTSGYLKEYDARVRSE